MELLTAFILGLAGSVHCAGMCGPLALALPAAGRTRTGFWIGRGAYNAGRIITYCLLGVLFGLIGRSLVLAGLQQAVSIALGVGLIGGLIAWRKPGGWRPIIWFVGWLKSRLSWLLSRRDYKAQFGLGLLNGLLPCGLVYVAAAGATATGGLARGAAYMAMFGVGTVPMLLTIGLTGKLIPFGVRLKLLRAAPVAVFLLGVLLILRGLSLGIPYLSPDLTAHAQACCSG